MPEEQPKSPLVPGDDVFSSSGAGAPPPLSEAPKTFSKPKTQIEITPEDLSAPSGDEAEVPEPQKETPPAGAPPTPEPAPQPTPEPQPETKKKRGGKKKKEPASAPTPTPTPPAPPPKKPEEYTTLAEAGMEGTGWREETKTEAVGVPARTTLETGTLAPLGGAAAPLHARAEVTAPSLENPDFRRYMEQVAERGVFTGLGRKETPEFLKQSFESRKRVAQGVIELYSQGQIAGDLGLPFGKEEIAPIVSAHIEKLSFEQPEKIVSLNKLLSDSRELPRQIGELEARRHKLASGEELREAAAQMDEKKKVLEEAKALNRFLPKLKFWEDATGWGRLAIFHPKGRETLVKARRHKVAASVMLGGGSWLREGKIGKELKGIDAEVAHISAEKTGDLAVTEQLLGSAKQRLNSLKLEIIGTGVMHEEAAEVIRKGIQSAFGKMLNPPEPSVEVYEAAEETLANLERVAASPDSSVLRMDYLRYSNPAEIRAALQKKSEGEAARVLRTLFLKTLESRTIDTEAKRTERVATLIAALEPWLERTKIGSRKGKLATGLFILEQIKNFHDAEVIAKGAAFKTLRESVAAGAARPEDEARLKGEEAALRAKDALLRVLHEQISSVISARERREPPSPPPTAPEGPSSTPPTGGPEGTPPSGETPPSGPGAPTETPPLAPSSPSSAHEELRQLRQRVLAEEKAKAEAVLHPRPSVPEGGAATVPRAPEALAVRTFEDVVNLPPAELAEVLKLTTMDKVSAALSFSTAAEVQKVRTSLTDEDKVHFDRLQGLGILNTDVVVERAKKELLEIANKVLANETPQTPREETT